MSVRRLLILLAACALLAPAAVRAADPGTGGAAAPPPDPRLATSPNVMLGKTTTFSGVLPLAGGATATVERLDAKTGTWLPIASAPIAADGSYRATWTADVAGRITTRVTAGRGGDPDAALAGAPPEAGVTIYRRTLTTWFGPGFFGKRTYCGQRMSRKLLGVAHRSLPCGTPVAFFYKGRSITVPVVDTGPFNGKMRFDLTFGAAKALGLRHTDTVGAVRVGAAPQPSR